LNTPVLFLGATILFWAWQTGQWLVAVPIALALESARATTRRWNFSLSDYTRAADLCTVIVVAVGVVLYVVFGNPAAIKLWFQWLAVMLLPLAVMQAYGSAGDIELSALVWSLRRMQDRRPIRFNVGFPYAAIWLLGASAANARDASFYAGVAGLAAWALWTRRPQRAPAYAWLLMLGVAASLGYAGQAGLNRLQVWFEANVPDWIFAAGARTDPYESRTDLGRIGEIKGSSTILMRVRAGQRLDRPLLLHRASYDDYLGSTWIARSPAFTVIPRADAASWVLADSTAGSRALTIDESTERGNPVLSLPAGTTRIEGLAAVEVRRNPMGAVQAELGPGIFRYIVRFTEEADTYALPSDMDLRVPRAEARAVGEVAQALGLNALAPKDAAARISRHFLGEFRYALYQPPRPMERTPLAHFLLASHEGHCEYFATATVLLLRAAGVPARYATGFSVQEYSTRENAYVVRQRHAHAWASAWIDGRWTSVDTTPPDWFEAEAAGDSAWTAVSDLWSWLRYRWGRMTEEMDRTEGAIMIGVAALLLAAWFGWRLMRGRAAVRTQARVTATERIPSAGADSEFYRVEARLAAMGWERPRSEALSDWLDRIIRQGLTGLDVEAARRALRLHYRYRFDPAGIARRDRDELRGLAGRIVAALDQAAGARSNPK